MANALILDVREMLGEILGLEEHLRAGTAPRDGGRAWGTSSDGERAEQRVRLRALRHRLERRLAPLPPSAVDELRRSLDTDSVIHAAYLDLQLLAASADSDRIAFPRSTPEEWEDRG